MSDSDSSKHPTPPQQMEDYPEEEQQQQQQQLADGEYPGEEPQQAEDHPPAAGEEVEEEEAPAPEAEAPAPAAAPARNSSSDSDEAPEPTPEPQPEEEEQAAEEPREEPQPAEEEEAAQREVEAEAQAEVEEAPVEAPDAPAAETAAEEQGEEEEAAAAAAAPEEAQERAAPDAPDADEEAEEEQAPAEAEAEGGAVATAEQELHLGDYVCYERIGTNHEWRACVGLVVGFPSPATVKVAAYESVHAPDTRAEDPEGEEALRHRAQADGNGDLWDQRQELHRERAQLTEQEREATAQLFAAREETQTKQAAAAERVEEAVKVLEAARRRLKTVPLRQWRDTRGTTVVAPEGIQRVMRATMLVLYEDKATEWDEVRAVMSQPAFLDRVLAWDCSVTPMSVPRRRKIALFCSNKEADHYAAEESMLAPKRRRGGSSSAATTPKRVTAPGKKGGKKSKKSAGADGDDEERFAIPPSGTDVGSAAALDGALREYLGAQILCSAAAADQERVAQECFAEQQDQRALLREINEMRTDVARVTAQLQESRAAITGVGAEGDRVLPLADHHIDDVYYKLLVPNDPEGRFVQEVLLRASVLLHLGHDADEDAAGYVRLTPEQHAALVAAKRERNAAHDLDEMQELIARKEREEAELEDLRPRIAELRARREQPGGLSEEEADELEQLERLEADARHRHDATLARIADLYVAGRGTAEVTVAAKKEAVKYTRLQLRVEGDWEDILEDPEKRADMIAAFRQDMARTLGIPEESIFDIEARAGSLLLDFTVKHNGDLDDDELQELVNNGDFSALNMYYEKVTFKADPAPEPLAASEKKNALPPGFPGIGAAQTEEDYYTAADGSPTSDLDDDLDAATKADPQFRKSRIVVAPLRCDYTSYAAYGPTERYATDEAVAPPVAAELSASAAAAAAAADKKNDDDDEATATNDRAAATAGGGGLGLTETHDAHSDGDDLTETAPAGVGTIPASAAVGGGAADGAEPAKADKTSQRSAHSVEGSGNRTPNNSKRSSHSSSSSSSNNGASDNEGAAEEEEGRQQHDPNMTQPRAVPVGVDDDEL